MGSLGFQNLGLEGQDLGTVETGDWDLDLGLTIGPQNGFELLWTGFKLGLEYKTSCCEFKAGLTVTSHTLSFIDKNDSYAQKCCNLAWLRLLLS